MSVVSIHRGLKPPEYVVPDSVNVVKGEYVYYHYGCDGCDDRGWGCGYRSLQTLCSWCRLQQLEHCPDNTTISEVPSLQRIQQILFNVGDKPETFIGSREWIGSVEIAIILDELYNVPCKLLHVNSGAELCDHVQELDDHFRIHGSPLMMGGDSDAASKCILGTCKADEISYFLILDPHYCGPQPDQKTLSNRNLLLWKPVNSFMENSFYNICMPRYTCQ